MKNNPLKIISVYLFIFLSASCHNEKNTTIDTTNSDAVKLTKLLTLYDEDQLKRHPLSATYRGDHRFNDQLGEKIDYKSRVETLIQHESYLDQLKTIDRKKLKRKDKTSYDLLFYNCHMKLESLNIGFTEFEDMLPFNQLFGLPATLAELGSGDSAQPFRTITDYDNWLKRAGTFPCWVNQAIANMNQGIKKQIVYPAIIVDRILPQLDIFTQESIEDSLFYKPIKNLPASFDSKEKERLTHAYKDLIQQRLMPAYAKLHDYMRNTYRPYSRETVGLYALPDGSNWYRYLTRFHTTTELTPEAIHETGKERVKNLYAEMHRVKDTIGFKGDMNAFFNHLKEDAEFYYGTPEALLSSYNELKKEVTPKLTTLFEKLPKADYTIKPLEPFRAESASATMYLPASADGTRPGVFYVNTYNLASRPNYMRTALFLHEATPGHHFQVSLAIEQDELPAFRRFGLYNAYVEGWGLYAESLGKELGLYEDPYQYLGALYLSIWRANRLVVDTGLHLYGWSRQKAIDWMSTYSPAQEHEIVTEVDRYIALPGQALSYMVGSMTIKNLRTEAEHKLGDLFDIREFHSQILDDGALPLHILKNKVHAWIRYKLKIHLEKQYSTSMMLINH